MPSISKVIGAAIFTTYFWYCALTTSTSHFIDAVNLIFHEAGHAVTIFLPNLITAFMGSGFQVLIPVTFVIYFYQRREVLSAYLLMLWLGQNLISISVYIRDAIPMKLSLLGGDYVTHDWNFILGQLGMLKQSELLANILCFISYTMMFMSTILIVNLLVNNSDKILHNKFKL